MTIWILSKADRLMNFQNQSLIEEAKKLKVKVLPVAAQDFDLFEPALKEGKIMHKGQQIDLPDLVLTRQTGMTEYAHALLLHLEARGVRTCNSSQSIRSAEDKLLTTQYLTRHQVPIPHTLVLSEYTKYSTIATNIGYPAVFKNSLGAKGESVHLVSSDEELRKIHKYYIDKGSTACLLQEYIEESSGHDARIFVIGGKAIAGAQRKAQGKEFRSNVALGGIDSYFEIDEAAASLSEKAAASLGLDIAGVDLLFGRDGYLVCEVNSSPCFEGFQERARVKIAPLIMEYLVSLDLN